MIRAHISGDHPDKILECLMCGEATADKASFFHHIQTHVYAADNVFYRCHVCPTNFAVKYELQQHAKRVHPPSTSFVCGECDLTFYDARNLGRWVPHLLSTEIREKASPRVCDSASGSWA